MLDFLNLTNANGEVITLFDGKLTLSQALAIVATIAVVLLVLKIVKTTMKVVFSVIAVCVCLVYFNIASPAQIKDAAAQIASAGIASYETIADSSKNIRLSGSSIQICVGDNKWVDVSDVTSIVGDASGKATVTVGAETYVVDDSAVIQLIKSFT